MQTTYWSRNFGVMIFKDAPIKEDLLRYYIKNEACFLSKKRIVELGSKCYTIVTIVSDERKLLAPSFGAIPVQMCQFHQLAH
jgi:hypothetical protein